MSAHIQRDPASTSFAFECQIRFMDTDEANIDSRVTVKFYVDNGGDVIEATCQGFGSASAEHRIGSEAGNALYDALMDAIDATAQLRATCQHAWALDPDGSLERCGECGEERLPPD